MGLFQATAPSLSSGQQVLLRLPSHADLASRVKEEAEHPQKPLGLVPGQGLAEAGWGDPGHL